ncbi:MAG: HU family DNA-binding protein [Roseovarius sp.]|nr:HU family DNA-binding protein [Roseovarius sp.]
MPTLPASPAALPELKRQELLAEVARRTEIRRNVARPVLEAALAVIGEALAEGRDLNLAPLGKLKVNRMRAAGTGRVIVARIRQGAKGAEPDRGEDDAGMKEEVAEPSE